MSMFGIETGIFILENKVSIYIYIYISAADGPAAAVLIVYDKWVLLFHGEEFQLPVPP